MKRIETILRMHPFLQGISEHQYRILSDCAMQSHFGADELIFCEGDPANRFIVNGEPPYNAPFDVRGHVAAEWDEEIHSDIKRRLLTLLPERENNKQ